MLKHYVLIKLKEGELTPELVLRAKELLSRCVGEIDGFEGIEAHKNCFPREENYDLMLVMDMRGPDTLREYLPHRLHREFIDYIAPKTVNKITFDQE